MISICNLKDWEHKCSDCEKEIECDLFCHSCYLCDGCDDVDDETCDFYEEENDD